MANDKFYKIFKPGKQSLVGRMLE